MTMDDQLTIHWMTMSCVLLLLQLLLNPDGGEW